MQVEQAQEARAPRSAQKRKRPEHEQNDDTGAEAVPSSQPHRPRPRQRQRKAAKPRAGQGWSCKQRSKEQTSQARAGASAGGGVIGAPADEGAGEDAQLMAPTLLCDDLDDCLDRDAELAGAETVGTDALDGIAMREVGLRRASVATRAFDGPQLPSRLSHGRRGGAQIDMVEQSEEKFDLVMMGVESKKKKNYLISQFKKK